MKNNDTKKCGVVRDVVTPGESYRNNQYNIHTTEGIQVVEGGFETITITNILTTDLVCLAKLMKP